MDVNVGTHPPIIAKLCAIDKQHFAPAFAEICDMGAKSINTVLADNLRRYMSERWTNSSLAKASGVAESTIRNYLSPGKRTPSSSGKEGSAKLTELAKIAAVLEVQVSDLVAESGNEAAPNTAAGSRASLGSAVATLASALDSMGDLERSRAASLLDRLAHAPDSKRVRDALLAELRAARREAISSGDGERVDQLEEAADAIKDELKDIKAAANKPDPVPAQPQQIDSNLQAWLDKNEWFGVDTRTTGIANGLGESIRRENPGLQGQAFLDKLDEELAATLPHKFGKTKKIGRAHV